MRMSVFYMPSIVTTAQSDGLIKQHAHRPVVDMSQTFSVPVVSFCISRLLKPRPILSYVHTWAAWQTRTARRFFFQSHQAHLTEQSRPALLRSSALKMHDGWVALKRSRYKRKHCSVCLFFLLLLMQSFFTLCVRPFRNMAMTSSGSHFRQTTWGRLSAWTFCRQKGQADRGWQRYCKGCPSTTQTTKTQPHL